MVKSIFIIILSTFSFQAAFAQKDTAVYYLKSSGKIVTTKDSADFVLVILPPDTGVDKNLFVVKEFYKNGSIRLMGNSTTNDLNLKFEGSQICFFPNRHKMRITSYKNGDPVGDVVEYYPNGKLCNIKSYFTDKRVLLKQFNDSTGSVLAEDGKGKWKEFDENFSAVTAEGEIKNGLQTGTWHERINDSVSVEDIFDQGKLISTNKVYKYKSDSTVYSKVDMMPEFPGGVEAFHVFLIKNVRPPAVARENHIQGKVIISYVVEKDGNLTNMKVVKGIGGYCEEEAMRVIKSSLPWKPGIIGGKIVRAAYSVSINFIFQGHSAWITVDRW